MLKECIILHFIHYLTIFNGLRESRALPNRGRGEVRVASRENPQAGRIEGIKIAMCGSRIHKNVFINNFLINNEQRKRSMTLTSLRIKVTRKSFGAGCVKGKFYQTK